VAAGVCLLCLFQTAAMEVGKALGALCKERGIETVVFDRGGFMYHGRVQAVAEGAREAGLIF
jgi:large subunit ribosomal protein L18